MKTLFTALFLSSILFSTAQTTTNGSETVHTKHGKHAKQKAIAKELNLTANQQEKIVAYNKEFATKHKAIHSNTLLTEADKKTQTEALKKQRKENFETVLTPEQKATLKTIRKKGKQAKDATAILNKKNNNYPITWVSNTIGNDIKALQTNSKVKYTNIAEQLQAIDTVLDNYIAAIGIQLNTEELEALYDSK